MTAAAEPEVVQRTRSYFLAGTMQGGRTGAHLTDQSYRELLTATLLDRRPDAVIHDPGVMMTDWLTTHPADVRASHAALRDRPVLHRTELAPELGELTELFHRLTRLAAESDVCVAWLPGHEPSMGTAAEMLSAYRAGRTVVAITEMRQNLAVLSCSSVILPDLQSFSAWLDAGGDLA